jgi:hypothetical protein
MRFIVIIALLGYFGCLDKQPTKQISVFDLRKDSIYSQCKKCDSIFASFPKDSGGFEKLFGYPNGQRYDGHEDIEQYFVCLDNCYDYNHLITILLLGNEIKYDADAPMHLQYFMSRFLMNHLDSTKILYNNLDCSDFERHIKFLFESIDKHDHHYETLCNFLKHFDLKDPCKLKHILKHCK